MRASPPRLASLASPALIAALVLLVTNDYFLKPMFHNWATGKLSDFAGLLALAIFCATFSPRRRLSIGVAITAAFAFWKSGLSQPLIDAFNGLAPFPVSRTVDYSDLSAVPVVWLGLWADRAIEPWPLPRTARLAVGVFALFAFTATSFPPPYSVHSTVELAQPGEAAPPNGAEVQTILDDVAAKHALHCTICDPLGEGRRYTGPSASTLTANFDEPTQTVYFRIVGANDKRAAHKEVDRLSIDIRTALGNRFPALKLTGYVSGNDPYGQGRGTTLTVRLDADTLDVAAAESAQRALSQIIEDTVRENGLRLDAGSLIYYAGKRVGPTLFERELTLMPRYNSHASFAVSVESRSDAYEPLQRSLAATLRQRLEAAFGADRVTDGH